MEKASKIPQSDLRKSKNKTSEQVLAFVSKNNPKNPNVYKNIQSSIDKIKNYPKMKNYFENIKIIHSRKQPPNLERILCTSKYVDKQNFGVKK